MCLHCFTDKVASPVSGSCRASGICIFSGSCSSSDFFPLFCNPPTLPTSGKLCPMILRSLQAVLLKKGVLIPLSSGNSFAP